MRSGSSINLLRSIAHLCMLGTLTLTLACQGESVTSNAQTTGTPGGPGGGPGEEIPPERRVVEEELLPGNQAGLPDCKPALAIGAKAGQINPQQSIPLLASGGTGDYRYEKVEDSSGGDLNRLAGIFKAGERSNSVAKIRLTDQKCRGEAVANFQVVDGISVFPSFAQIVPQGELTFEVMYEGTKVEKATYSLMVNQTGATISDTGLYKAGMGIGRDVVVVEANGQQVEVTVAVASDYKFELGYKLLGVGQGNRVRLARQGGSGVFEIKGSGSDLVVIEDQEWIRGVKPGEAKVEVVDKFTKEVQELTVQVAPSLSFDLARARDNLSGGDVMPYSSVSRAIDFNKDGKRDVIFGTSEADITLSNQGAALLYLGTDKGVDTKPAMIFQGKNPDDQFGAAIALGDFDGDGLDDLAISAGMGDVHQRNQGYVAVYKGLTSGLFEQEPSTFLAGNRRDNQFGSSLAACDFNNDGLVDLAVGVPRMEDYKNRPVAYDQGGVQVYFGTKNTGLPPTADQEIFGSLPDGAGEFSNTSRTYFGTRLAAGEIDGQPGCDLVMVSHRYSHDDTRTKYGALVIHKGIAKTEQTRGGVAKLPSKALVDLSGRRGYFGQVLSVVDLDQDGKSEVVVAAASAWRPAQGDDAEVRESGFVRVISVSELPEKATQLEDFYDPKGDWSYWHDGSYQQFGYFFDLDDSDNDGDLDLLISTRGDRFEVQEEGETKTKSNYGTIRLFKNESGKFGDTGELVAYAAKDGDRFGARFRSMGDLTGDGALDFFGYASSDDTLGRDVGRVYSSTGLGKIEALDYPGNPASSQFGRTSALGTKGGDLAWVALGSELVDYPEIGPNGGQVIVYDAKTLKASGERKPVQVLRHKRLEGNARFAYALSSIKDLNGDGVQELGVVTISDRISIRDLNDENKYDDYINHNCGTENKDMYEAGSLMIFMSKGDKFEEEPAYRILGPQRSSKLQLFSWDSDVDGDRQKDLLLIFPNLSKKESHPGTILKLAPLPNPTSGKTTMVCTFDAQTWLGGVGRLGSSVAPLGDLDGDGCEDVALGAPNTMVNLDDRDHGDTGSVVLAYGYGDSCATAQPRTVEIEGSQRNARFGAALAVGDFEGNGQRGLMVGSPYQRINDQRGYSGAVRYFSRAALKAFAPEAQETISKPNAVVRTPGNLPMWEGSLSGEQVGYKIATMIGGLGDGRDSVLISSQQGDVSGTRTSGGVVLLEVKDGKFQTSPMLGLFAGDTEDLNTLVGYSIAMASSGQNSWVLLGTPRSNEIYPQGGGGMLFSLTK